ncbi:hypothetical protein [Entomomonas asaccharolytica]|uniref:DUF4124 domain-containing protein n=1 Tax=Entomomonas asaccharolytica TaxID=2785331 RepID=A0A974NHK7_9GAMM|nr:hypothetical protein [Entomomonas asaccharolytica]QQP86693.1 hypothetical protein JHT90_05495 [Entomomonas asaccharolytica]
MKKILFIVIVCGIGTLVQAQSFKCKQSNGRYLYSDKPCVTSSVQAKKTVMTPNGAVVPLANDITPIPLPSVVVTEFFTNIGNACKTENEDALLEQFSEEMQQDIKERIGNKTVFEMVSSVCNKMNVIKEELNKSSEQTLFASKRPSQATVLCFYKETKGLDSCIGNIQITAEHNKLKLNGY